MVDSVKKAALPLQTPATTKTDPPSATPVPATPRSAGTPDSLELAGKSSVITPSSVSGPGDAPTGSTPTRTVEVKDLAGKASLLKTSESPGSSGPDGKTNPFNLPKTSGPGSPGGLTILGTTGPSGISGPGSVSGKTVSTLATTEQPTVNYEFWRSIRNLEDGRSRELMDWLEWNQDHKQAQPHNGRFGTNGMTLLSQLDINSPAWEAGAKDFSPIPRAEREYFTNAAKNVLLPENKALLDQVHGGDGIFEWDDITNWLASHPMPPTPAAPPDPKHGIIT